MKCFVCCSLVAAALALLCAAPANAGGPYNPACNCMPVGIFEVDGISNALELSIDTCGLPNRESGMSCSDIIWKCYQRAGDSNILYSTHRIYTKIWGTLKFNFVPAILPTPTGDTTPIYPWTVIDTQFASLYEGFRQLDSIVGGLSFRITYYPNDVHNKPSWFQLIFNQYINSSEVLGLIPPAIWDYAELEYQDLTFGFPTSVDDNHPVESVIYTSNEILIPTTGKTTVELFSIGGVL